MSFYLKKKIRIFFVLCFTCLLCLGFFRYYVMPKVLFPMNYRSIVEKYAKEYDLPESLVFAIINVESGFNKNALSQRGAKGLMQIMDTTGEWGADEVGIENFTPDMLFDPETNIHIGCWYIDNLIEQFDGELDTVLASYNAGSGNVSKWLDSEKHSYDGETLYYIPFEQTRNYVKKVNINRKIYKNIYGTEK